MFDPDQHERVVQGDDRQEAGHECAQEVAAGEQDADRGPRTTNIRLPQAIEMRSHHSVS